MLVQATIDLIHTRHHQVARRCRHFHPNAVEFQVIPIGRGRRVTRNAFAGSDRPPSWYWNLVDRDLLGFLVEFSRCAPSTEATHNRLLERPSVLIEQTGRVDVVNGAQFEWCSDFDQHNVMLGRRESTGFGLVFVDILNQSVQVWVRVDFEEVRRTGAYKERFS